MGTVVPYEFNAIRSADPGKSSSNSCPARPVASRNPCNSVVLPDALGPTSTVSGSNSRSSERYALKLRNETF